MSTKQIYVIQVRTSPPPVSNLLPSERRYSAQGVLGLACVHLTIAVLSAVLAVLRAHVNTTFWPFFLVPIVAGASGTVGLLAWRRWYENIHIRLMLLVSGVSTVTCVAVLLADVLTKPQTPLAPEVHAVLVCALETAWSALSMLVAWRGVRNKGAGEEMTVMTHPISP